MTESIDMRMVMKCVAYQNGLSIGDVTLEGISDALEQGDTFVWLGLREADHGLLVKIKCPTIIGLKASNGDLDQITEVIVRSSGLGRPFSVFSGDDSLTLPILAVGGVGVISVAANIMPRVMADLVSSCMCPDMQQSRFIMHAIHGFCRALLKTGSNPAPIKSVMNRLGMGVGSCRKPLVDLTEEKAALLFEELQTTRLWLAARHIPYDDVLSKLDVQTVE